MTTKEVKSLRANPENPRLISDTKLTGLGKTMEEYGDLGCIVFNRRTKHLVGGTQRVKHLPKSALVKLTKVYESPSRTGTVALGFVIFKGERFTYREVDWSETKEKAANLAANKNAGQWDEKILGKWLKELDEDGFDLDLTMFDEDEREAAIAASEEMNFEPGSGKDQGQLDEKKKTVCPHCGESFLVGGRK